MRFSFPYSHAFHGGRLNVHDDGAPGPACIVEFSDGSVAMGQYTTDGENVLLSVPSYSTAKGTAVEARKWKLVRSPDGGWRAIRG